MLWPGVANPLNVERAEIKVALSPHRIVGSLVAWAMSQVASICCSMAKGGLEIKLRSGNSPIQPSIPRPCILVDHA